MDSKIEKCQAEIQNALDMLEVSNAVIANFQDQPHTQQEDSHPPDRQSIQVLAPHKDQLKSLEDMNSHRDKLTSFEEDIIMSLELWTMRTEDKPMQEIQDVQEETQLDGSLVTQLPSKLRETVCSLKVQNEPYAELSQTAGTGKQEDESNYTSNDVQAAWNHESHYASNEMQVVNDPRPARKKEEAARKAFLSNKSKQNRKYRNWLLADADARLASKGKAGIPRPKNMSS